MKLRTAKNGPVVRGKVRLPHAIEPPTTSSSDATTGADSATPKIAVICAPDSDAARTALSLGAVAVGEDEIFTSVKDGTYTFTHLLCHEDSAPALARQQSVLGPVLGRKGLMPTARRGTVTSDIATAMREIISGAAAARAAGGEVREYRERLGVVRMKVGGIWFTPRMLADNVAAFMKQVKEDVERIDEEDGHSKALDEVVLASTNSPGFSLNGAFGPTEREPGLKAEMLEGPM